MISSKSLCHSVSIRRKSPSVLVPSAHRHLRISVTTALKSSYIQDATHDFRPQQRLAAPALPLTRSSFSLAAALAVVAEQGEAYPQLAPYAFRRRLASTSVTTVTVGGTRPSDSFACDSLPLERRQR